MRVRSDRPTRNGGYLHNLGALFVDQRPPFRRLSVQYTPRAEAGHTDAVHTKLLRGHLFLAKQHRSALLARGLDDAAIKQGGYRSVPSPNYAAYVARALSVYGLEGVPGFYKEAGLWRMVTHDPGLYVPVRDARARISGLQIRRDDIADGRGKYFWYSSANWQEGTSSGSPLHHAKPHLLPDANEVFITEGALKADVIAHFLDLPVIAAAGVTNFGPDFAAQLKENFPQLRTTVIGFDSDWRTKPQVENALLRLQHALRCAGFAVVIRTWPVQYKGLDDFLCARARGN